jgi:hypothetical protein
MESLGQYTSGITMTGTGYYLHAGALYDVARDTYLAMPPETPDRAYGPDGALVCLVFGAACLEAFVNEAGTLAHYLSSPGQGWGMMQSGRGPQPLIHMNHGRGRRGDPVVVYEMAARLRDAETNRVSTTAKYDIAFSMLLARKVKGDTFFQEIDLLFSVRNAIMHTKAQEYELSDDDHMLSKDTDRLMARLKAKALTTNFESEHITTGLLGWIATRASARWACNTAVATVRKFVADAPDGDFKSMLVAAYEHRFKTVT